MSSFIKAIKNPKTGKIVKALFLDDYYGEHRYGVGFRKDGKDVTFKINEAKYLKFYKEEEL